MTFLFEQTFRQEKKTRHKQIYLLLHTTHIQIHIQKSHYYEWSDELTKRCALCDSGCELYTLLYSFPVIPHLHLLLRHLEDLGIPFILIRYCCKITPREREEKRKKMEINFVEKAKREEEKGGKSLRIYSCLCACVILPFLFFIVMVRTDCVCVKLNSTRTSMSTE